MRRRLFTCFSALSLLLCVAVCALWVRSHWVGHTWQVELGSGVRQRLIAVSSAAGKLRLSLDHAEPAAGQPPSAHGEAAASRWRPVTLSHWTIPREHLRV